MSFPVQGPSVAGKEVHDGEEGVLGDDDVHVRVPSPPGVPGGATGL